jgi:hypothetical protein
MLKSQEEEESSRLVGEGVKVSSSEVESLVEKEEKEEYKCITI